MLYYIIVLCTAPVRNTAVIVSLFLPKKITEFDIVEIVAYINYIFL